MIFFLTHFQFPYTIKKKQPHNIILASLKNYCIRSKDFSLFICISLAYHSKY